MALAALTLLALASTAIAADQQRPQSAVSSSSALSDVPPVFRNGAWDPDHSGPRNSYVAALLSKDVYYKHVIDPRDGAAAARNFTVFSAAFCRSMTRLGADECEAVAGTDSVVWALVRAGPSVMLVIRGSSTPQDWITDLTSLRTTNVGDFGGGVAGANVAQGFYQVFSANRRAIVDRVRQSMNSAAAAAAAAAGANGTGDGASGARLWLFGHSLGGAVALMAAAYLDVREGLTPTGVYTFGCPRVGDATWHRAYKLHEVTLRLENAGDIVPTLPFGPSWRDVGSAVAIRDCGDLASPLERAGVVVRQSASATVVQRRRLRGAVAFDAAAAAGAAAAAAEDAATMAAAQAAAAEALAAAASRQVATDPETAGRAEAERQAVAAVGAADAQVLFPFPFSLEDHMMETYVRVLWSCLPDTDQDLVPGPEDVYGKAR